MATKITTLKQNAEYLDQTLTLIERSFNYRSPHLYKNDFVQVFQQKNLSNCFILVEGNEVLASTCTIPKALHQAGFETSVCFIGALSAQEKIRGQGIFGQFFADVLKIIKGKHSLLLLWSDMAKFYSKFDFYEAGSFTEYSTKDISSTNTIEIDPHHLSLRQKNSIAELYQKITQNYLAPKRTEQDWEQLFAHPSIHFYIEEKNNEVINYWLVGKGMDLQNICHESSSLTLPNKENLLLWHPEISPDMTSKYTAFIAIDNPDKFQELLSQYIGDSIIWHGHENQMVNFSLNNQAYSIPEKDFIQGLFGPHYIEEIKSEKLKLWIPGFESI